MQKKTTGELLGNTALLAWSTLCLVIFICYPGATSYVQFATLYDFSTLPEKLSRVSNTTFWGNVLVSFLGMAYFGASSVSLGRGLAKLLRLDDHFNNNAYSQTGGILPTYFLIGNAVFSLIFLTIASVSRLSREISIIILSLGLLSGLIGPWKHSITTPRLISIHSNGKIITILSLAILALSLFQSSARLSWDASAIYFSNAKLTSVERHAGYFMENTFVVSSFHSVIQYTAIMQIFGDQSARMIAWLLGAVNIAIALSLARLVGISPMARRILPAMILTSTAFLDLMGDGKVDLFSSAYSLAAIHWMVVESKAPHQIRFQYILVGCLIGFACILRPFNIFLLGVFTLAYFIHQIKAGRFLFPQSAQYIGLMAVGAVGFALYHLLLNKIILGSPFAFWASVISIKPIGGPWDYDPKTIWIQRLLYPVIVTYKNNPASLGNITPWVIIFLPLLAVRDIRKRVTIQKDASQLAVLAGATLISWIFLFFTIGEVRYVIFLWVILFIPVAEIVAAVLETDSAILRNAAKFWIAALMCFILARSAYISVSTYSPLDPHENPKCFDIEYCKHLEPINELAGQGERVLMLSAYRYYVRTDLFACSTKGGEYQALRNASLRNVNAFWEEIYRQGYSYIAYENNYSVHHLYLDLIPNPENVPNWMKLEPIYGKPTDPTGAYKIIILSKPPVGMEQTCVQENNMWLVKDINQN